MADSKITALAALTAADPVNDMFPVVDVSDTSMAASGTTKRISVNNILSSSPTASGALTVTGLVTAGSASVTGALGAAGLNVTGATIPANGVYLVTTNKIGFSTNSTQRFTIDSFGNLENPTTTTGNGYLQFSNTADGGTLGYFGNPKAFITGGATSSVGIRGESSVQFSIGTNLGMTLNSSRNLAFPSGKGIDFSAVTGGTGTATANVLNDYEEGTFVPTISSGATAVTFSTNAGTYTKIGRLVTVFIRLVTTAATRDGNQFVISGLPFSAVTDGSGVIAYNSSGFISTAGGNKPNLLIGGADVNFFTSSGGNFVGTAIAADVFEVRLTATYYV